MFFLNDEVRYAELEFSPRGRQLTLLLKAERKDALHTLPLPPAEVEIHNPCLGEANSVEQGCAKRWLATAVIPR